MYQEKEFLGALLNLPDETDIKVLEKKYTALILFQIAERCERAGLINNKVISFCLDDNREHFSIVMYSDKSNILSEKGLSLLRE